MTSPEIMLQRRAMAIEESLEATYENTAALGLPTGRIEDIKAEPLLSPDDALPVLAAELAQALAAERRHRQELGHAIGELLERVEAMEKAGANK
jgi:hypothetical protein